MRARIGQGLRALAAWTRRVDYKLAAQYLTPAQMALFRQMRRSERLHSLNVLRTLRMAGHTEPALMTAALLHDVGKSRAPFYLWERVVVVLVKAASPSLARHLGTSIGTPRGLRRPFVVSYQHPAWSAEMVAAAGADALALRLIATHAERLDHAPRDEAERLLVALQAADDAN